RNDGVGSGLDAGLHDGKSLSYIKQGRKNYIINGNMNIRQRGDTFASSSVEYFFDRWEKGSNTDISLISNRYDGYARTGKYAPRITVRAGETSALVRQKIELGSRKLAGKVVTVSFDLISDTNNKNVTIVLANSNDTGINSVSFDTGTVGLKYYEFTFTVPDDIGPDDWKYLRFQQTDSVAGNFFEISNVQLEEGNVATQYEYQTEAEELALCKRYYQVIRLGVSGANAHHAGNTKVGFDPRVYSEMRVAPSVAFTGGAVAVGVKNASTVSAGVTTSVEVTAYPEMFTGQCVASGTYSVPKYVVFPETKLDAEI
ncbi:MAG: hypothetical protein V3S69_05955, partial [Dehalococcoidales bacterium]